MRGLTLPLTIVILGLLAAPAPARAAVQCEWTGKGANNRWSTAGNWTGCLGAPMKGDSLYFPPGASQPASENDIADLEVLRMVIGGVSKDNTRFDLSGLAVTVRDYVQAGTPDDASGAGPIVRMPLVVGQFGFAIDKTTTLFVTGLLSGRGANGIVKTGTGTLVLSNPANTSPRRRGRDVDAVRRRHHGRSHDAGRLAGIHLSRREGG